MIKALCLLSVILAFAATAPAQDTSLHPTLLQWHSRFKINKLVLSSDGVHLVTLGDDNNAIISDLKKRIPVTSITATGEGVLLAHPKKPYFFTSSSRADTFVLERRRFPDGAQDMTTALPSGINGWHMQSPQLVEIDFNNDRLMIPYDSNGSKSVLVFSVSGQLLQQLRMPDGNLVNGVVRQGDITWASDAKGLYRSVGDRFEKLLAPQAGEVFGNLQTQQGMLVILSDDNVTWYDPSKKSVSRTAIPGFFGKSVSSRASILRFHHPFYVDAALNAWVADTRIPQMENNVGLRPYSLACVTVSGEISYPFQNNEATGVNRVEVEPQFAFNENANLLAMMAKTKEVIIAERAQGPLFTLGRKNLPVRSLYFTSTPGKILLQTDDMRSPAFLLNLANGRMETIGVMDDIYYRTHETGTELQPKNVFENLWWPSQQRYHPAQYWSYKDEAYLRYPFRDRDLPAVAGRPLVLTNTGELQLQDAGGKILKRLQLFGLVNRSYPEVKDGKFTVETEQVSFSDRHQITGYQYDSTADLLVVQLMEAPSSNPLTVHVIDLSTFKIIRSYADDDMLVLTRESRVVNGLGIFDLRTQDTVALFPPEMGNGKFFTLDRQRRKLFFYIDGYEKGDQLYSWDISEHRLVHMGTQAGMEMIDCDPHSDLVYTKGQDEVLRVWNGDTGASIATLVVSGAESFEEMRQVDGSYLVIRNDGYYMGENKYYQMLKLHDGTRSYSISEVDVLFHRPDKVLQSLGYADASVLKPIRQQAEKRAARSTLLVSKNDIRISNGDTIPYFSNGSVDLHAKVPFTKEISGVRIYVNGTALNTKPLPVPGDGNFSSKVSLVDPVNNIRIALVRQDGKETPGDYIYVAAKQAEGSELYVVGIGASRYLDSIHNLRYATKDMNDLVNYLYTTDSYQKVHITRFKDEQVKHQITDSVYRFLQQARDKDVVLCYYAGHGMLDKQNDYYLGTWDISFDDPALAGLDIRKLNEAIAASAARKKVIFIDACHSGLVDDLATAADTVAAAGAEQPGVVKRGLIVKGAQKASAVQFTFNHFNQGTGVDIVAASAGNEYALERGDISNGVFTYSLLKALKSGEADFNKDKQLTLYELQQYVSAMTRTLTRGAQRPTFRQNNLYQDITLVNAGDTYVGRFMDAAKYDNVELLKLLLESNEVEVNQEDKEGFTALDYACREGSFQAARYLLGKGADMHHKTDFGASPLYLAAWNSHYRVTYLLLVNGASTGADLLDWQNQKIEEKNDAATLNVIRNFQSVKASQEKHLQLAIALMNGELAKADTLYAGGGLSMNVHLLIEGVPLVTASMLRGNAESLRWAIAKGGDVNLPSLDDRYTPLMFAAAQGMSAIVRELLAHGADRNLKDSRGRTAADHALQAGQKETYELVK